MRLTEPSFKPDGVLVVPDLTLEALLTVINGQNLAVVVPGWYPVDVCALMAEKLTANAWTTYNDPSAAGIGTVGGALFNCVGASIEDGCRYWREAAEHQRKLDQLFFPYLHPMQRLKDFLDGIWPGGCQALRKGCQVGFYGLLRRFDHGGAALPHTDNSAWDHPCAETAAMTGQLFANLYLATTEAGGALQMWRRQIPSQEQYDALRDGKSYGVRRDRIGPPDLTINPSIGDLIIGNARYVHAVSSVEGAGSRISSSSFIGIGPTLRIYS